jgi:hypothetical protein
MMPIISPSAFYPTWYEEKSTAKRIKLPFRQWCPVSGGRTTAAVGAVHLECGPNVAISTEWLCPHRVVRLRRRRPDAPVGAGRQQDIPWGWGLAGSAVVSGRLSEVQLGLGRFSPSRCQRWGSRREAQTLQNGAGCFGILNYCQQPHPFSTARTREGINPEHSLEKLCPEQPSWAWTPVAGGLRMRRGSGLTIDGRLRFQRLGGGSLQLVAGFGARP